jgi:hypothetical protein
MGFFDNKLTRAEKGRLKKMKRQSTSEKKREKRKEKLEDIHAKTAMYKAKGSYLQAKHGAKSRPLFDISIGKKKQSKTIHRRRIGL